MRWRGWYRHDANSVQHVKSGLIATLEDLHTPATVAAFVVRNTNVDGFCPLDALDVVALLTCANELVWCAFNFHGIGDWVDDRGVPCGQQERPSVAARG